jgi:hypothetical protein
MTLLMLILPFPLRRQTSMALKYFLLQETKGNSQGLPPLKRTPPNTVILRWCLRFKPTKRLWRKLCLLRRLEHRQRMMQELSLGHRVRLLQRPSLGYRLRLM